MYVPNFTIQILNAFRENIRQEKAEKVTTIDNGKVVWKSTVKLDHT